MQLDCLVRKFFAHRYAIAREVNLRDLSPAAAFLSRASNPDRLGENPVAIQHRVEINPLSLPDIPLRNRSAVAIETGPGIKVNTHFFLGTEGLECHLIHNFI